MKRYRLFLMLFLSTFALACSCLPTTLFAPGQQTPEGGLGDVTVDPYDDYGGDSPDNYSQASQLAGHWTGTWTNTTFDSSGDLDVTIEIQPDGDAVLTIDIGGNALGVGNVPTLTIPGYYDDSGWVFDSLQVPVFGNMSIAISYTRAFTMGSTTPPDTTILYVMANGMALDDEISVTYDVSFKTGTLAKGTATLTRAP